MQIKTQINFNLCLSRFNFSSFRASDRKSDGSLRSRPGGEKTAHADARSAHRALRVLTTTASSLLGANLLEITASRVKQLPLPRNDRPRLSTVESTPRKKSLAPTLSPTRSQGSQRTRRRTRDRTPIEE